MLGNMLLKENVSVTITASMRESRKFYQRGSSFDNVFDEMREDPNSTKSRPSSAPSLNGVSLACR